MRTHGRVLIVAGSDSGGGAGIQADIKATTTLGGFAMTAITALTAQNTEGVFGVHPVPVDFIEQQMVLVLRDIGADAVKLGMLHSAAVIDRVADVLEREAPGVPVVVDPVMVAKGGARLLDPDAISTLKRRLPRLAAVMTPNLPEAGALVDMDVADLAGMRRAADALLAMGARAVLVKGGHLEGPELRDLLVAADGCVELPTARIDTPHTHGTGCTLASAIATGLAQGLGLEAAVRRACAYVHEAIRTAPGYGHGHGPLNHAHTVSPFPPPA